MLKMFIVAYYLLNYPDKNNHSLRIINIQFHIILLFYKHHIQANYLHLRI